MGGRAMPELIRLYNRNIFFGFLLALVFTAALVVLGRRPSEPLCSRRVRRGARHRAHVPCWVYLAPCLRACS